MGGGQQHPSEMSTSKKQLILILTVLAPSPEIILPLLISKHLPEDKYIIKHYPKANTPEGPEDQPTHEEMEEAVAVLGFMFPKWVTSHAQMPKMKLVQLGSAGYGHIEALDLYKNLPKDDSIIWASASGIHAVTIAEHVIASCMAVYHGFAQYIIAQRAPTPKWLGHAGFEIKELRGKTCGILAYGHIGREVARQAHCMGMKILAANRQGAKVGIKGYLIDGVGDDEGDIPVGWYSTSSKESMHEFYSSCDMVVNTLPASTATVKFVDEAAFRSMKNSALYCSIGRGDTTDQDALITALKAGLSSEAGKEGDFRIESASLDVTTPEPLPSDSPLWGLENVLLTPHMSGSSELYFYRATDLFGINVKRVVEEGKGALNAFRGRGEDD